MSLSARIALEPSRRLAALERLLAGGGIAVAAATAAVRWPDHPVSIVAAAVAALGLLVGADVVRRRRSVTCTLVVGDRAEVGLLEPGRHDDDGGSWQLVEPTMLWPALAVVALRRGTARRTVPVLTGTLDPSARRAIARFLVWALRSGRSAPSHGGSTS